MCFLDFSAWLDTNDHMQFIDPESGIGATFFTNVLPHPDIAASNAWDALERGVYSDLLPSISR